MTETQTYEDKARKIGTEHGENAASWVELDEETAEAIDSGRLGVFEVFDGMSGPLSGEWADGYSVRQLIEDTGADIDEVDSDLQDKEDELASVYEEAYWQAFEAEVLRKVEAMRGPILKLNEDAAFTGPGPDGIAWRYVGQTFGGKARFVMVGDDREFLFDIDEMTELGEDQFCHGCGQVGCTADGRSE